MAQFVMTMYAIYASIYAFVYWGFWWGVLNLFVPFAPLYDLAVKIGKIE